MTDERETLQQALIRWFQREAEPLPWRADPGPYEVWLSEIMLQQTQVATVIPYYQRFLAAFPGLSSLAAADLDAVLKLWEGLGYYSRARNLYRAAQIVVAEHNGEVPHDLKALLSLPGIGRYTAGAILNFAFGIPAPILDGNVIRVFSRLFDLPDDVSQTSVKEALWARAEALLPGEDAPLWNEGLMELGRRICVKANPACALCPIAAYCAAFTHGTQAQRPHKPSRGRTPHVDVTAAVIGDGAGRFLIAQRPVDRMLGGLWEFPGGKCEPGETLPDCLTREISEELGLEIAVGAPLLRLRHAYTHFRITLHVFEAAIISGEPRAIECADWRWVTLAEMANFAFPVTDQQIIRALSGDTQGQRPLF